MDSFSEAIASCRKREMKSDQLQNTTQYLQGLAHATPPLYRFQQSRLLTDSDYDSTVTSAEIVK